jgi:hypothetical protein
MYCISCDSERKIQAAERWFFNNVDTGNIPVFVIFARYDKSIRQNHESWQSGQSGESQLSLKQDVAIAEALTFFDFRDSIEKDITDLIAEKPRIQKIRIAIPKSKENKLMKYRGSGKSLSIECSAFQHKRRITDIDSTCWNEKCIMNVWMTTRNEADTEGPEVFTLAEKSRPC